MVKDDKKWLKKDITNFLQISNKLCNKKKRVINKRNLPLYWKYDQKLYLEKEQKPSYISLYKMFLKELDTVKYYLNFYLAK